MFVRWPNRLLQFPRTVTHQRKELGKKTVFIVLSESILMYFSSLYRDVGNVVEAMYGDLPPPIMLIGHSMGGAIAVHTASSNLVPSLLGLCMIDVVEGEFS